MVGPKLEKDDGSRDSAKSGAVTLFASLEEHLHSDAHAERPNASLTNSLDKWHAKPCGAERRDARIEAAHTMQQNTIGGFERHRTASTKRRQPEACEDVYERPDNSDAIVDDCNCIHREHGRRQMPH